MSRLTRDGTAEPVSRDRILRRERGQGNIHFLASAEHEQDWQPYPVNPYSCYMCEHTDQAQTTVFNGYRTVQNGFLIFLNILTQYTVR